MTQLRFSRSAIRWIAVIGVASLLTAAGAWGEYLALHSMRQTLGNSSVLLLLTPGYILAGILAALFASGGIHSIGEFTWLGVPVSWIFYFGGWPTLPRGTGLNPCTIETRGGAEPFEV
jgi:Na+/alanine symporter